VCCAVEVELACFRPACLTALAGKRAGKGERAGELFICGGDCLHWHYDQMRVFSQPRSKLECFGESHTSYPRSMCCTEGKLFT
jgi:hypothetical protein